MNFNDFYTEDILFYTKSICILLIIAAFAKSAKVGLYI